MVRGQTEGQMPVVILPQVVSRAVEMADNPDAAWATKLRMVHGLIFEASGIMSEVDEDKAEGLRMVLSDVEAYYRMK